MRIRDDLQQTYRDIYTSEVLAALEALAPFNARRRQLMAERIGRRQRRMAKREPIGFLDPDAVIGGTDLLVGDARKAADKLGWKAQTTFKALVGRMVDHDLELARRNAAATETVTGG